MSKKPKYWDRLGKAKEELERLVKDPDPGFVRLAPLDTRLETIAKALLITIEEIQWLKEGPSDTPC